MWQLCEESLGRRFGEVTLKSCIDCWVHVSSFMFVVDVAIFPS